MDNDKLTRDVDFLQYQVTELNGDSASVWAALKERDATIAQLAARVTKAESRLRGFDWAFLVIAAIYFLKSCS